MATIPLKIVYINATSHLESFNQKPACISGDIQPEINSEREVNRSWTKTKFQVSIPE
jgi:hypothetical protein